MVAYIRRLNPMWIMIVSAIGGLAVGACFIAAGQRAEQAAIDVQNSAAFGSAAHAPKLLKRPEAGRSLTTVPLRLPSSKKVNCAIPAACLHYR